METFIGDIFQGRFYDIDSIILKGDNFFITIKKLLMNCCTFMVFS